MAARVARAQGWYYLATGIWPLVSRRSFEAVTGPKRDFWLAQTVGVVVGAIGAGLVAAGHRERVSRELATIGLLATTGLTAVDVVFVGRGTIRSVYLADAVLGCGFAVAWLRAWPTSPAGDDTLR